MNRHKKYNDKNKARIILSSPIKWGVVVVFLVLAYEIVLHAVEPKFLPIHHVKMDIGHERVNISSLKDRIHPYIKGFFSTDVMALKKELLAEPFVADVNIRRIWPDTLRVTIKELEFVANWRKMGAVTTKGEVMPVKLSSKKRLPTFVGPDGRAEAILQEYNELSSILAPGKLTIAEILLNSRESWQVTLDNGIQILLGRKDMPDHLSTFVSVYPKLKKLHGSRIASIDLRHSNGLAVRLLQTTND